MRTTEEKVDTSKALDASSVDTECSRTESKEQDTSSRSGNDAHADDADIRPIYDEEPMGKPMSQPLRNQSVVRQPTAFESERPRITKPRYDSQVDVHNNLSKPVTTHYLPKEREAASAKPHHMIVSSNSRISLKNMTRFSSNDMVHNHYLEEAKARTQEHSRNSKPSLLHFARSQSIANETSVANNTSSLVPQRHKASDNDNPDPVPQRQDVYSSADADVPSQQELDMLFGPLYDEFFNAGTNPSTSIPSTSAPSTHTNMHAEENNNDQAEEGEHIPDDEFTNPFYAPTQEVVESSLHNIGNSNVPTFNQPQYHTPPRQNREV
nr:hypothetical protein [Tanacetum cinerariifolium]